MTEGAQHRLGFSTTGGRRAKAEKILAILAAAGSPLKPAHRVLDLGCGSGEIASHLARYAEVSCADAIDQRTQGQDLPFQVAGDTLPFADHAFDVVVSNHVIEHVPDAANHLREIHRVVRPGGTVYLATPNRWWPWEFHAHLPLLHYLPAGLFSRLAMRWGRLGEPVRLVSLRKLVRLARGHFDMESWHPRVLHDPARFQIHCSATVAGLLGLVPQRLLGITAGLQPTLILLLRAR
ncbi:MAG: class I SAM-dependent methyltransferase [Gammaproteobacteria bacterium]|nr:class I SAM-dependent methyltransferase [Gammaproteobacteria bacterium]